MRGAGLFRLRGNGQPLGKTGFLTTSRVPHGPIEGYPLNRRPTFGHRARTLNAAAAHRMGRVTKAL